MVQQPGGKEVSSDPLLAAIERTAAAIEHLQKENAALAKRLRELEQSAAELKKDADWFRWFRHRYGDSTFFAHIEREYQSTYAGGGNGTRLPLAPTVRPEGPVWASDPARHT